MSTDPLVITVLRPLPGVLRSSPIPSDKFGFLFIKPGHILSYKPPTITFGIILRKLLSSDVLFSLLHIYILISK